MKETPYQPIDIVPFDPHHATAAQWAAYHAYRRIRAEEDIPGEPILSDADFEHHLRRHRPMDESRRVIALHGERVVGNLLLEFRRAGTPDYERFAPFVGAGGGVMQAYRRQGIATALLGALLAFMQEHGKTTATLGAAARDANAFLQALGATEKHRAVENRLPLGGLDWDALDRWQANATSAPGAHLRWEIHAGRVPLDRLARLMAPFTVLIGDMPLGALDLPAIRYELPAHVSWYEEMDRSGGEHLVVMLLDGDEVAAVCNAHWEKRFPDRVFQALTAVARPWRGKGLAKGVKAAMLKLVRERHPEVRMIVTHNAEVNAPMLSINRRLGFAVYRQTVSYQIDRESLGRRLGEPRGVRPPPAPFR